MTVPLFLWFAQLSSTTSVIVVLLSFTAVAIFIIFVSLNADFSGSSSLPIGTRQRDMVKVINPFFFKVEDDKTNLKDGLKTVLSSLCPCDVLVVWGPRINPLHDLMLWPGVKLRQAKDDLNGELYSQLDALHVQKLKYPDPGEHTITLPCPDTVCSSSLGSTPRGRYPVVVMAFIPEPQPCQSCHNISKENDIDPDENVVADDDTSQATNNTDSCIHEEDSNCIVGLVSIIHLQDETVPSNSYVIGQYIKTAGVPLYSLQPLFMSNKTPEEQDRETPPPTEQSTKEDWSHDRSHDRSHDFNTQHQRYDTSSDTFAKTTSPSYSNSEETKDTEVVSDSSTSTLRNRTTNKPCVQSETIIGAKFQTSNNESKQRYPGPNNEQGTPKTLTECVVCQTRHATCVILPCRHVCVCLGCFKLLDKCPMCRGKLESYFLLGGNGSDGEEDASGEEEEDEDVMLEEMHQRAVQAGLGAMWQQFNGRLNALFGFR